MTKYIVEYLIPSEREWAVYYRTGKASKTRELTAEEFLKMDNARKDGKYVFIKITTIEDLKVLSRRDP